MVQFQLNPACFCMLNLLCESDLVIFWFLNLFEFGIKLCSDLKSVFVCSGVYNIRVDTIFTSSNFHHERDLAIGGTSELFNTFAYRFHCCVNFLSNFLLLLFHYVVAVHIVKEIEHNLRLFAACFKYVVAKVGNPYLVITEISVFEIAINVLFNFTCGGVYCLYLVISLEQFCCLFHRLISFQK